MLYPCVICGKEKYRPPAHAKRVKSGLLFCSRACRSLGMRGPNHQFYSRIKRNCKTCNKEFFIEKNREKTGFWCSRECKDKLLCGHKHFKWKKKMLTKCGVCGMGLLIYPRDAGKKKYCSRECANKAHSRRMRGCKNSNYVHGNGYAPYSFLFVNLRHTIRSRDGFCCFVCGKTESDEERELEVHHIDWNKENNIPENLVSLCIVCHRKQGGKLDKKQAKSQELSKLLCERYNYSARYSVV